MSLENINDTIGNRILDLPVSPIVITLGAHGGVKI